MTHLQSSIVRRGSRVLLAWFAMLAVLVVVGVAVRHVSWVSTFDHRITAALVERRTPALNQAMTVVTWAGSWIAAACLAATLAVLYRARRLPLRALVAMLAAWVGQVVAVDTTKAVVARPRPSPAVRLVAAHGSSFPSGHAATAVVVFGIAALLASTRLTTRAWRAASWCSAVLCSALVGFSRIELGVHWTSDVVASAVWTSCWLVVVYRLARPEVEAATSGL
jgi:membrane-associated phospholipid phosphatase